MSRIESVLSSRSDDFQGEKLTVESAEETTPIYRAVAYVSAAVAVVWAVAALVIWIAPFA